MGSSTNWQLQYRFSGIRYVLGNSRSPSTNSCLTVAFHPYVAAATTVNSEPLSYDYNGILGLALPLNSIISTIIPPVTNNDPDGASFSSNLFGITPRSQAPAAHYFSLVLQRPGSDRLPSLLGIGRHPSEIISDPSKIEYSALVSDQDGVLFWKTDIRAITVYVNSAPMPVDIPSGVKGSAFPVAVLDSGVSLIITTSTIANGIYGALGIGPASDGQCGWSFILSECQTPSTDISFRRLYTLYYTDQHDNNS